MNLQDYEEAVTMLEYLMDFLERQEVHENTTLDDLFQPYLNVHQQKMLCMVFYSEMHYEQKVRVGKVSQRFLDWNKEVVGDI